MLGGLSGQRRHEAVRATARLWRSCGVSVDPAADGCSATFFWSGSEQRRRGAAAARQGCAAAARTRQASRRGAARAVARSRRAPGAPPPPMPSGRSMPPPPPPRGGASQQAAAPGAAGAKLTISYQGETFPVTKDRFIIGRGKQSSDLTIKDPNVSRQHAMIEFSNGQYYIVDMGSTNGVEYNGQRVQRKVISEGDAFKVCDHELRFSYS